MPYLHNFGATGCYTVFARARLPSPINVYQDSIWFVPIPSCWFIDLPGVAT